MKTNNWLTKTLAVGGTLFLWLTLLSPVFFAVVRGRWRFDYLMPAELFPLALLGGALLVWAALRAHAHARLIGAGIGLAVGVLAAGMLLASVSGLASGETESSGLLWWLVLASLAVYALGLAVSGWGGALLLRDLFRPAV